ncbi:hypothetical protein OIU79_008494 [Salix purpurea]|uniref:Uncharacterized protein n=1 Tax=Salix purpurea TaxID=77065 RepID=A0A9Q0TIN8_SALPP|nr:hypothetical protein OIU79_008494 [Salix purpurea]
MKVGNLLFDDYVILFWFCGDAVGACQFAKMTAASIKFRNKLIAQNNHGQCARMHGFVAFGHFMAGADQSNLTFMIMIKFRTEAMQRKPVMDNSDLKIEDHWDQRKLGIGAEKVRGWIFVLNGFGFFFFPILHYSPDYLPIRSSSLAESDNLGRENQRRKADKMEDKYLGKL